jgi:hypothetical protein
MPDWVSIYCPHCRRSTSLKEAPVEYNCRGYGGTHTYTTGTLWKKDYNKIWWIGVCNYCRDPVLILNQGDIIYPHPLPSPSDGRIPEHIKNDLDEAEICFSVKAYCASAVMLRRAIQSASVNKGSNKETLV